MRERLRRFVCACARSPYHAARMHELQLERMVRLCAPVWSPSAQGSTGSKRHLRRWRDSHNPIYHPITQPDPCGDLNIRSGASIAAWIALAEYPTERRRLTHTIRSWGECLAWLPHRLAGPTRPLFARRLTRTPRRRPVTAGRGANTAPPPSPHCCSRHHTCVSPASDAPLTHQSDTAVRGASHDCCSRSAIAALPGAVLGHPPGSGGDVSSGTDHLNGRLIAHGSVTQRSYQSTRHPRTPRGPKELRVVKCA